MPTRIADARRARCRANLPRSVMPRRPNSERRFLMPGVTYDQFERYQQEGLDARRAGQWDSARIYLLEAARAMLELSKTRRAKSCARPPARRRRSCSSWPRTARRPRRENGRKSGRKASAATAARRGQVQRESEGEANGRSVDRQGEADDPLRRCRRARRGEGRHPPEDDLSVRAPGIGRTSSASAPAAGCCCTARRARARRCSPRRRRARSTRRSSASRRPTCSANGSARPSRTSRSSSTPPRRETRSIIFIDEIEALVPARRDEGSQRHAARRAADPAGRWKGSTRRSRPRRSCSWARPTSRGSSTRRCCGRGDLTRRSTSRCRICPPGERCWTSIWASDRWRRRSNLDALADAAGRLQRRRHQVHLRPRGDDPVSAIGRHGHRRGRLRTRSWTT